MFLSHLFLVVENRSGNHGVRQLSIPRAICKDCAIGIGVLHIHSTGPLVDLNPFGSVIVCVEMTQAVNKELLQMLSQALLLLVDDVNVFVHMVFAAQILALLATPSAFFATAPVTLRGDDLASILAIKPLDRPAAFPLDCSAMSIVSFCLHAPIECFCVEFFDLKCAQSDGEAHRSTV